ncbi:GXWXG protein [Mycobacterium sp. smrl_JER01]
MEGAFELFDSLPAVEAESMLGTWHGAEMPTGHPVDGMLANSGWWGKQFLDPETVHPLLFTTADGRGLWALNPAPAFLGLALATKLPGLGNRNFVGNVAPLKPVLQARSPKARLRTTRYRGVETATMIYDQLPVNDVFRLLDGTAGSETVLGVMDMRGMEQPYFFLLHRDDSLKLV